MTSATNTSSITKIEPAAINILAAELSFPFTGGSLCEPENTDVGIDVIVGVGLGILVARGVEVGTTILDVGLGCGVGMEVGRRLEVGVGCVMQLQGTVVGITPPPP